MQTTRSKLIFVLVLVGCGLLVAFVALSRPGIYTRWRRVHDGMTQAEVSQLLGSPSWIGDGDCTGGGWKTGNPMALPECTAAAYYVLLCGFRLHWPQRGTGRFPDRTLFPGMGLSLVATRPCEEQVMITRHRTLTANNRTAPSPASARRVKIEPHPREGPLLGIVKLARA